MITSIKKLRDGISSIKPVDLVYPGITLTFIIIVGILFFTSTRFISKSINDAFSDHQDGNENSLNMQNYTLVAKKLGISLETQRTPGSQISAQATTPLVLDKKLLKLLILNGSNKSGVAASLALDLEQAGFIKADTGSEEKKQPATTIIIKENRVEFSDAILKEVQKKYTDAIISTTTNDILFDVTIIIGGK